MLTFAAVMGGWTSVLLSTNSTFNLEVKEVINKMYMNQKNFVVNVKDLSLLLVKDANKRFSDKHKDLKDNNNISKSFNN